MKKKIILYTSIALLSFSASTLTSCGGAKDAKQNETAPTPGDSTKTTAAYVCPMGPQCGTGETAGKCPSCGMEMVKNEKK